MTAAAVPRGTQRSLPVESAAVPAPAGSASALLEGEEDSGWPSGDSGTLEAAALLCSRPHAGAQSLPRSQEPSLLPLG